MIYSKKFIFIIYGQEIAGLIALIIQDYRLCKTKNFAECSGS